MTSRLSLDSAENPGKLSNALKNCRVIGLLNNTEVFGQERANLEVFKALRRHGAKVLVGLNSEDDGGQLKTRVAQFGFEAFTLPFGCQWSKTFFRARPQLLFKNLAAIYRCSRILAHQVQQFNATHIHLGNPLVYSFIAPYLWHTNNLRLVYRMGDEPPFKSKPNLWIWHRCVRRATQIAANSEFVRSSIAKASSRDAQRIKLIYNVAPANSSQETLVSCEQHVDHLRVLYVGQIAEHKGVHHFVDCAIELAKRDRRWHFDIVGGSTHTREFEMQLRQQIAQIGLQRQVVLHGTVADPTPFYRSALVLVVPSLFDEPAANVVLEAKCAGTPAIVYPSGGLPELVSEGQTGFTCSKKDKSLLLEQIRQCLVNPSVVNSMRSACISEYALRFDATRFDREWCDLYRDS